jgi:hypothetical protein
MSSENSLSFFGAGGHSHDGANSTLIDTRRYSLFDFSLGYKGSQTRINAQSTNQGAFEEYVIRIVNQQVLQPAGITLSPDTLDGEAIRANTITARELQANTITASEIASNTITATQLTSNIVLVNNIIRSTNIDGTFHANGVINSTGTTGWGISYAGSSVFNDATIRGRLTAGDIYIPSVASPVFSVASNGALTATSAAISGVLTANAGSSIGPFTVSSSSLSGSWSTFSVRMFADVPISGDAPAATSGGFSISGTRLSLFTNEGLYFFAGSGPPLWGSKATTTYFERGFLRVAGNSRIDLDSDTVTTGRIRFWRDTNQISSIYGEIIYSDSALTIQRKGGTSKLLSLFQDSDDDEFLGIGKPIGGAGGATWETLFWNNVFGTVGRSGSSIRYKENVQSLEDVGHIIDQLRPVSFIRRSYGEPTPETEAMRLADMQYGFIAEEVMEIDNGHLSVFQAVDGEFIAEDWRMRDMIALLVKEVQSLRVRIAELEPPVI